LLTEFAPTNRVLSGESIIFQNEMLDIFKEIINRSTHPMDEGKEAKKEGD
jgi:hypothetical protein